jgi:hypothetical protein
LRTTVEKLLFNARNTWPTQWFWPAIERLGLDLARNTRTAYRLRITIKSFYARRARNTRPAEWLRIAIELPGFDLAWLAGNTDWLWITAGKSSCSKRRPKQQKERQQDLHFHIASPARK